MEQQYLIDSNAAIDYLSGNLPPDGMTFMNLIINNNPRISVITKIEVLGYKTTDEASQLLSDFINDLNIIALDDQIVDRTIEIRKEYKIKTPDSIIAATAISLGLSLISRNERDFKNISNLSIINPHAL